MWYNDNVNIAFKSPSDWHWFSMCQWFQILKDLSVRPCSWVRNDRILHELFNGSGRSKGKHKEISHKWLPKMMVMMAMVKIRMTCMVTEEESGGWHLRCQLKSVASELFCQQAILHHNTIITDVKQVNWWFLLWNSTVKHDQQTYFMTSWMLLIQDGDTILYHCYCHR